MTLNLKNIYWQFPETIRRVADWLLGTRERWTLHAWLAEDGSWQFSYPPAIFNEQIGDYETAEVISWYVAQQLGHRPEAGQKVVIVASSEPLEDSTAHLQLMEIEDFGSTYRAAEAEADAWLCPLVQTMWGWYPPELFLKLTPR